MTIQKANTTKSISVGVEEVLDDEFFQLFSANFSPSILVDDLDVWGDISCSGLELLVHCTVTVNQPLRDFNWLADAISIAVICFDYFSFIIKPSTWRDFCIPLWKIALRFRRGYGWSRSWCWWLDFGRIALGNRNCSLGCSSFLLNFQILIFYTN